MRKSNYIPALEFNYELFTQYPLPYWTPARRVPLSKIKIDKSLMSNPNPIYEDIVQSIVENFDELGWIPITLDKDYYLLDGQHRLEAVYP